MYNKFNVKKSQLIFQNAQPKCILVLSAGKSYSYIQHSGLHIAWLHSGTGLIWSPLDQWSHRKRNVGIPQGGENSPRTMERNTQWITLQGVSGQYETYSWSLSECQWSMGVEAEGASGGHDPTYVAFTMSLSTVMTCATFTWERQTRCDLWQCISATSLSLSHTWPWP